MEYVTSFYRQQGRNGTSLLLQQYLCRQIPVCFGCICAGAEDECGAGVLYGEKVPGGEAVPGGEKVPGGEAVPGREKIPDKEKVPGGIRGRDRAGGYLTGRLLAWCRGFPWVSLAKRKEKYFAGIRGGLEEAIEQAQRELWDSGLTEKGEEVDLAGMLCVEEKVVLFGRGRHRIFLLNSLFGKGYAQELTRDRDCGGLWFWEGGMERNVGIMLASGTFASCIPQRLLQEALNVNETFTQEQADRRLRELAREGERRGGRNMAAVVLYGRQAGDF